MLLCCAESIEDLVVRHRARAALRPETSATTTGGGSYGFISFKGSRPETGLNTWHVQQHAHASFPFECTVALGLDPLPAVQHCPIVG